PPPSADILAQADRDTAVSANAPAVAAAPRPAPPPATMAYGRGTGGATGGVPARTDAKSAPPAAAQTVTVESATPQIDSTSSIMMKQGINSRNVTSLSALASGAGFILSPDNKVWWKLGPGGTVELTADGGKKWKSLDTGATSQLTVGAAPSSKVCWIAGKAGTLVLTTDRGRHWTRISTPIDGDLGGVRAADANHASIWDAAKRMSYETSDGGATWKQIANE
ncbi:MAG TPA: YCF48-related protein, partial [Candidatus Acidoferrum sp.]|nr:YCF48-related protein [Candidatus Acidoferrum sp.]